MRTHFQESTYCEEAREAMSDKNRDRRHEGGFALILAILALMLLTFLGLTLATTTSTELRIATNYRWNTQALYNAEAGIEADRHRPPSSMCRTDSPHRIAASTRQWKGIAEESQFYPGMRQSRDNGKPTLI